MAASARILQDLQTAADLFVTLRSMRLTIPDLEPLLAAYRAAITANQILHQDLGLAAACAACAATPLGSCCFPGVENNYDPFLLLVNLLLGVELPDSPLIPNKCFFLGPQGCRLTARHYYCQRFLCPEITSQLAPTARSRLEEALSREQAANLALEKLLRSRLGSTSPKAGSKS